MSVLATSIMLGSTPALSPTIPEGPTPDGSELLHDATSSVPEASRFELGAGPGEADESSSPDAAMLRERPVARGGRVTPSPEGRPTSKHQRALQSPRELERPRRRGSGLLLAGAAVTPRILGLSSLLDLRDAEDQRRSCGSRRGFCGLGSWEFFAVADGGGLHAFGLGLGLLGSGLHRRGRWRAFDDAIADRRFDQSLELRHQVGWGLIGGGAAIVGSTISLSWLSVTFPNSDPYRWALAHELGFWVGGAALSSGIFVLPWAQGYRRAVRDLQLSPMATSDYAGFSFVGSILT